ncbi:scavenger receptor class B member 1-like [Topomyia yanbarensis]|uniref:scavenger receptor class B member 1-like n=1 Tax=Topomyia yanbarensis TaxID=2498891 RepID=UPI00273CE72E|nr:scavenger receptor class B member 1-like [Topomyia yanbarensis]XP_058812285.1 scavenger receptor class B member 1-like [Topomyia yanbarensis]XP_058812286.1 scavenger receptor class B member 1-like [Topomyia yanbarensis]
MTTTPVFPLDAGQKRIVKFGFLGLIFIALGCTVVVIDPTDLIVTNMLSMYEGSYLHRLWKKPPLDVFISIYVFNVTNADAFLRGEEKIRLVEVGPYVYQEYLENHNSTFNANGTLSFTPVRHQIFVPDRSVSDPQKDLIIVPNIALLGVSSAAYRMSAWASLAVAAALKPLGMPPFLNISVHDLLWGYDDPLVNVASTLLPDIINFEKIGILDRMFDDGYDTVTINLPESVQNLRKAKIVADVDHDEMDLVEDEYFAGAVLQDDEQEEADEIIRNYSIDLWNGSPGLAHWGYVGKDHWDAERRNTPCNTLQGSYDGTVFPRNISKTEIFRVYRKAFCRTLPIAFERQGEHDGIEAYWFSIKENAFESSLDDPYSSCYCRNGKCLPKGLGDLSPCWYNIPVAVSLPHFYKGDPTLVEAVDGLKPDKEKHDAIIIMQPQLGIPMKASIRVQINLLTNVSFNADLRSFHNRVIPLIWAEMAVEKLTPDIVLLLHLLFDIAPYLQSGCVYLLWLLGVSLLATTALMLLCSRHATLEYDPRKSIRYSTVNMIPYPLRKELEKYGEGEIRREALLIENEA